MSYWLPFLQDWSNNVINLIKGTFFETSPPVREAIKSGWLGYEGAKDSDIKTLEERLGVKLPETYKDFLKTTNGWLQIGFDAEDTIIWPSNEVDWFRIKYPESLKNWLYGYEIIGDVPPVPDELYFIYGEEQDPVNLRNEYLKTSLSISMEVDGAIYLLNPEVISSNGEWESWFFGYHLPGANRYRSFREMMEAEYLRIIHNIKNGINYGKL